MGWSFSNLLEEFRSGVALLRATAPADRADLFNATTPTVAVLLQRSTALLDDLSRERFALLGVFAPKLASSDHNALKAVWLVDDAKPTIRTLVDHGLLEPTSEGRFQMHALPVMHAKSMFLVQ